RGGRWSGVRTLGGYGEGGRGDESRDGERGDQACVHGCPPEQRQSPHPHPPGVGCRPPRGVGYRAYDASSPASASLARPRTNVPSPVCSIESISPCWWIRSMRSPRAYGTRASNSTPSRGSSSSTTRSTSSTPSPVLAETTTECGSR